MAEIIAFLSNSLVSAVLLGYLVVMWLALTAWTAIDIFSRTSNWFVRFGAVILVGLGSVFGFLLYLIVRPPTTLEDKEIRDLEEKILESQSRVSTCPKCGEILRDDFLFCTNCATAVKRQCPGCQRALEVSWAQCPFCGTFVGNPVLPSVKETPLLVNKSSRSSLFEILKRVMSAPKEPTEIKRGRGRPRKNPLPELPLVKRPRGRPRKNG
jgi:hypothetical protein